MRRVDYGARNGEVQLEILDDGEKGAVYDHDRKKRVDMKQPNVQMTVRKASMTE